MVDNAVHKLNGSESSYDACPPSTSPKFSNSEEPSYSTFALQVPFYSTNKFINFLD